MLKLSQFLVAIGLAWSLLLLDQIAFAQKKSTPIAPAEKLAEGWEEIDERLIFLMVRLANTETSLEAVENAIAKTTGKKSVKIAEGKNADRENEAMDRKGGGPTRWSTFYGTTAEKFFYHPTDRNSTYHTVTVLSQQGPRADNKVGGGVPAGQGLPVHQRPPQFDYIYRANEKAKVRAESEAAAFKGKINELIERRHRLEAEQAGLWCEIAFRAVAHYDLHKKPLYRFEPLLTMQDDPTSKQHAEVMKSAAGFMRLALSIIDAAQNDQATTFSTIKTTVSEAREKLDDTLLRQGVDVTDKKTPEGKFAALAKRLDDVASNLSDSFEIATEGDQQKDQQRKDTFRGLLQESLVNYAQVILALDEMSAQMKDVWKIKPDLDKPLPVHTSNVQQPKQLKLNEVYFQLSGRYRVQNGNGIEFLKGENVKEPSSGKGKEHFVPPIAVTFEVTASPDACLDIFPAILGKIRFVWGFDFNKKTLVVIGREKTEIPHIPIQPNKNNVIIMKVDKSRRLTITVNGTERYSRIVDANVALSGPVVIGGGIGHVTYTSVVVDQRAE